MKDSKIEWCTHTFNPFIGCSKVSPGCDHCYAETWAKRYGTVEWGPGKPRKITSDANWHQPLKWNREAAAAGVRPRVFCASLADVFDKEVPQEWRARLWDLIRTTPNLDWLLLTKRIGNIPKMLPADWGNSYGNVWLMISVVNQEEADRDIPKLLAIPARVRGLSMEPLLGPVDISIYLASGFLEPPHTDAITWVIVGGESGKGARPMHIAWARSLRGQCLAAGIPYFFKQHGEWLSAEESRDEQDCRFWVFPDGEEFHVVSDGHDIMMANAEDHRGEPLHLWRNYWASGDGRLLKRVGKKAAGRLLDGRTWDEFPEAA